MAYTSLAKIERDKALAQALRGNMGQELLPNWASGLAYVLNQYGANKRERRAADMEAENERLYSEDLAAALKGGDQLAGPTQSGQPLMRQYQTPEGQTMALQRALMEKERSQDAELQRELAQLRSGGAAGYGNTVVVGRDENGNAVPMRMTPQGLVALDLPGNVSSFVPSGAQMAYDPNAIAIRRGAETEAEVQNIQATAQPAAQAAAMEAAATTEARLSEEKAADAPKQRAVADAVTFQIDSSIGLIDQILTNPAFNQAFGIDAPRGMIPATEAYGVRQLVDTLKNRNFVDAINAMRQASAAGGAVGNVTEREGQRLENMIRPLDTFLSDANAKNNLEFIRSYLNELRGKINSAYDSTYGQGAPVNDLGLTDDDLRYLQQ